MLTLQICAMAPMRDGGAKGFKSSALSRGMIAASMNTSAIVPGVYYTATMAKIEAIQTQTSTW